MAEAKAPYGCKTQKEPAVREVHASGDATILAIHGRWWA